jgi:hypothetical protein
MFIHQVLYLFFSCVVARRRITFYSCKHLSNCDHTQRGMYADCTSQPSCKHLSNCDHTQRGMYADCTSQPSCKHPSNCDHTQLTLVLHECLRLTFRLYNQPDKNTFHIAYPQTHHVVSAFQIVTMHNRLVLHECFHLTLGLYNQPNKILCL